MRLIAVFLVILLALPSPLPAGAEEEEVLVESEFTLEEEEELDDLPDFFAERDKDIFLTADDIFSGYEPEAPDLPEEEEFPLIPGEEEAMKMAAEDPSEENILTLAILRGRHALSLLNDFKEKGGLPPKKGEFDHPLYTALNYAFSAAELYPDEPGIIFTIAQIYASFGQNTFTLDLAEEAAERVLELDPAYSEARLMLGVLQWTGRSFGLAADSLERALSEKPELMDLRTAAILGSAYLFENDIPRGEAFLRLLMEKNGSTPEVLFSLALLLQGAEKQREAEEMMDLAAKAFGEDGEMTSYARSILDDWAATK